jgi:hypothetical protein
MGAGELSIEERILLRRIEDEYRACLVQKKFTKNHCGRL